MAFTGTFDTAEATPTTFMSSLEQAHTSIGDLVILSAQVADHLCGSEPATAENTAVKGNGLPNGVFETIADRGKDMVRKAELVRMQLLRIQRALP